MTRLITRRALIGTGAAGAGTLLLGGCDRLNANPDVREALREADQFHQTAQRLLGRHALAREYASSERSPIFRANGNVTADDPLWTAEAKRGFAGWALQIRGLVDRPLSLPLSALQAMPQRRQTTRHDCVEGWSAIGEWQGPRLGPILRLAGVKPQARYAVFHCADRFGTAAYYESIDLTDAFHPQTILAWQMNGQPLAIEHGAPLRLRVERQLGYKQAKYLMAVELVESFAGLHGGNGGFWEDTRGYHWYAGI
jgi:DMSO/TMAO reductase YedYZ molybdopterin-dependent catalytic subunit